MLKYKDLPKHNGPAKIGALRIDRIQVDNVECTFMPRDVSFRPFRRSLVWTQQHRAHAGGYLVMLEDGTETFLAAEVFNTIFGEKVGY